VYDNAKCLYTLCTAESVSVPSEMYKGPRWPVQCLKDIQRFASSAAAIDVVVEG
jgi:hypothetical protein